MIEAAALISLLRQDWPDFGVVTGLLLYNAAVGFWQDNKAASALAALKKGLALKARALRGGQWLSVDAAELVPGDVVTVGAGEIAPADVMLIDGPYLSVDQAVLQAVKNPASLDPYQQGAFTPFDPVNKRTVATVTDARGRTFHYAKGAPQAIAELCKLDPVTRGKYDGQVSELAGRGAVASSG
jgi:magnesium-transporting ATPase (P-type)